jgi:hypothetical protein
MHGLGISKLPGAFAFTTNCLHEIAVRVEDLESSKMCHPIVTLGVPDDILRLKEKSGPITVSKFYEALQPDAVETQIVGFDDGSERRGVRRVRPMACGGSRIGAAGDREGQREESFEHCNPEHPLSPWPAARGVGFEVRI